MAAKANNPNSQKKPADPKARALAALRRSAGIISTACKAAKVGRTTFYGWLDTDADFKAAYEQIVEEAVDFTESQLLKTIKGYTLPDSKVFHDNLTNRTTVVPLVKHIGPDVTAIIFHLKTKGKKRGYVEKSEVEHRGKITTRRVIVRQTKEGGGND